MKNKIINFFKNKNNRIIFILLFILFISFLIISYYVPLTGDDWQNYGNGKFGFINSLRNAKAYYLGQEGRIGSRILIIILTYHKLIWNIVNALLFVGTIFLTLKLSNVKLKIGTICLSTLLLLLINFNMFTQVFFWIAGNITYTIPTFLFLIYLLFLKLYKNSKNNKLLILIVSLYSFGSSLFVENVSAVIFLFNLIIFFYYLIKEKKVNKFYLFQTISCLIGIAVLTLSPGTTSRLSTYPEFANLPIYLKIITNIPNFINYTYIINPITILLLIISYNFIIFKTLKNNVMKVILFIVMSIIPFITIISNLYSISLFEIPLLIKLSEILKYFNNYNSIFIIIYWIIFTIIYLLTIFKLYDKKDKYQIILLYILALCGTGSMTLTPVWSSRVAFITIILFNIISLNILKPKFNKKTSCVLLIITICTLIIMLIAYNSVHKNIDYQVTTIKESILDNQYYSNFYDIPDRLLFASYPHMDGYKIGYKDVYKISEDIEYKVFTCKYKYQIFFNYDCQ